MPRSRPSDGAAEAIRRLIDGIDAEALGAEMHAAVRELYPICRSITGDGLRRSLRLLAAHRAARAPRGPDRHAGLRLDGAAGVEPAAARLIGAGRRGRSSTSRGSTSTS